MRIYFTASIRGKSDFLEHYQNIFSTIEELGNKNIDDFLLRSESEDLYDSTHQKNKEIYDETVKNIKSADIIVLEVSEHSLSMGYVMQKGLEMNKPVILLYSLGHFPFFASTINDEKLQVVEYTQDSLKEVLATALDYAQNISDTRFNFFVSAKNLNYLYWIS